MNENLDKLIIEATKFVKIARYLLLFWVIFYFALVILGALGVLGIGGAAMYQKMILPQ